MTATAPRTEDASPLLREDRDGIATLLLNRPQAYNALSLDLMAALHETLSAIGREPQIRVVVIAGAGRGFCAGHDLRELRANPERSFYERTFGACSTLMQTIVALPKPVIARVHGVATAAGCQLVASCDLAIAAEDARFAVPGVNIGLFCSTPMVALSRAVGRKAAMKMLLTGDLVPAATAQQLGLVSDVVPAAGLDAAAQQLAGRIAARSPLTLAIGKEAFYRQAEMDLAAAYAYTSEVMTRNMLARDAGIGIDAMLNKTKPEWTGT
jgi:enoyl-CoA hydratase/carnithine racemase